MVTLVDLYTNTVTQYPRPDAFLEKRGDKWVSISTDDFARDVAVVGQALIEFGLKPGDRVAIMSENRYQWAVVDFAALTRGGVVVPVYPTLPANQMATILADSGASFLFTSTPDQTAESVRDRSPTSARPRRRPLRGRRRAEPTGPVLLGVQGGGGEGLRRAGDLAGGSVRTVRRGRSRHPHLHVRHHRNTKGRHAHPPQSGDEHQRCAGAVLVQPGRHVSLVSPHQSRLRAHVRSLHDVPGRGVDGVRLVDRVGGRGCANDSPHDHHRRAAILREVPRPHSVRARVGAPVAAADLQLVDPRGAKGGRRRVRRCGGDPRAQVPPRGEPRLLEAQRPHGRPPPRHGFGQRATSPRSHSLLSLRGHSHFRGATASPKRPR